MIEDRSNAWSLVQSCDYNLAIMESAKTTAEGFANSSQSLRYGGFKLKKGKEPLHEKQRQVLPANATSPKEETSSSLLSNQLFIPNLVPEQKKAHRTGRYFLI